MTAEAKQHNAKSGSTKEEKEKKKSDDIPCRPWGSGSWGKSLLSTVAIVKYIADIVGSGWQQDLFFFSFWRWSPIGGRVRRQTNKDGDGGEEEVEEDENDDTAQRARDSRTEKGKKKNI